MKNKQLLTSIILILVVITGIYLLTKNKPENPEVTTPAPQDTQTESVINESLVEEETYVEPDQYASFDVTYPQFKNTPSTFNAKIKNVVTEAIDQHKKDSAANWKARFETQFNGEGIKEFPTGEEKFALNISWKPVQVNSKFISFVITVAGYTGGAHGYENIISFNYDVKAQKDVTLKSLFPNDSNYLKTISDFSRKDLEAQFRSRLEVKTADDEMSFKGSILPMLEEGTIPNPSNFGVFTFTETDITLYFTEYQVAPYAMGSSEVKIPR